jgi:hypothetical protein
MRTISSATAKLSDPEIKCFLGCHIPYRLEFLRRGIALASDPGVRDPAFVEATLMAGRQLIHFLGLGIEFRGKQGPFLKPYTKYMPFGKGDDRCFEVKIVNLGGDFQNIKEPDEERILAEFVYAADKASAHLSQASNYKLWENGGQVFFRGCEIIMRLVSEACSVAESRLPS